ncbi:MAG: hypothetical protein ACRDT8_12100 [Micromonosporaceae bacterium]
MYERESQAQTAASRVGVEFDWPNDSRAADPAVALRILAEAADATRSNVLRTSISTSETRRNHIMHFVLMGRQETALFDEFTLARGRWFSPTESRTGSVVVSSEHVDGAHRIGTPQVFANGYGITFAPLHQLFDTLPATGRYVIEANNGASTDDFLAIVVQRLREAGVAEVTVQGMLARDVHASAHGGNYLLVLPYILVGVATLLVAFMLLREGKRIGVLRLMGYSATRIWYRVVGRLQLASVLIGVCVCAVMALAVPGADAAFFWALTIPLAEVAAAGLAATVTIGLVVIGRMHIADLIKGSMQ